MRYDVAILGGGPAGAVAAALLCRAGACVALVDGGRSRSRLEGLSPRVLQVLDGLGLQAEGCAPAVRRQVAWGELSGTPNLEHLVERTAFDRGLRRQAQAAGVRLIDAGVVKVARRTATLSTGETISAGLLVEARGRQAPTAPGRRRGPEAVALAGWSGHAEAPFARIAARPEGWVWEAAAQAGPVWRQLVVPAGDLAAGPGALAGVWRRAYPEGGEEQVALPSDLVVRAAELRLTAPELDPALPRLGDAAVALDPLSGHGVFWAVTSALAAQPLIRAVFCGEVELARRFYRDRVAETFWRQARIGRDFHLMAGRDGAFWRERQVWPDLRPAHPPVPRPRLRSQVVVRDGRLADAEVLVTQRDPGGVAFVFGREIAPILRRVRPGCWPDRTSFCSRVLPEVPPDEAGAIHDWFVDRGIAALAPSDHPTTTETVR